jgi:hypothetical protein
VVSQGCGTGGDPCADGLRHLARLVACFAAAYLGVQAGAGVMLPALAAQ